MRARSSLLTGTCILVLRAGARGVYNEYTILIMNSGYTPYPDIRQTDKPREGVHLGHTRRLNALADNQLSGSTLIECSNHVTLLTSISTLVVPC